MNAAATSAALLAAATVTAGLLRPPRARGRLPFTAGAAATAAVLTVRHQAGRRQEQ